MGETPHAKTYRLVLDFEVGSYATLLIPAVVR
jgi:hypothetical protein